jgi:hypothetical protein
MRYATEAEKIFHEEVRDKKRTASGVHSKTGKNGYVGTMRFPSDIMSRKDKIKYRKASKVMTSNLYSDILTINEFRQLEQEEQKNRMIYWRSNYSNKEIQKKMGIANSPYYKIIAELDLPKAPRTERTKPNRSGKTKVQEPKEKPIQEQTELAISTPEKEKVQEVIVDGLHLVFNGTYSPEMIIKQLSKFELLLDGEDNDYYIELKLMEKQKVES